MAPVDSRMAIRGRAETSRHYSIARPPEMSNAALSKPVLIIDGSRFADFDGFKRDFSALLSDYTSGGNLDPFNDVLRGGRYSRRRIHSVVDPLRPVPTCTGLRGHREAVGVCT